MVVFQSLYLRGCREFIMIEVFQYLSVAILMYSCLLFGEPSKIWLKKMMEAFSIICCNEFEVLEDYTVFQYCLEEKLNYCIWKCWCIGDNAFPQKCSILTLGLSYLTESDSIGKEVFKSITFRAPCTLLKSKSQAVMPRISLQMPCLAHLISK